MLNGIPSVLSGALLAHLDAMGHSEAAVVADAHFPAAGLADRILDVPGVSAPELVRAICSVLPLDDAPTLDLMQSADGERLVVQTELITAAGLADPGRLPVGVPVEATTQELVEATTQERSVRELDRFAFYEEAATAFVIVRSGETRPYGNAILRKGLAEPDERWRG